MTDRLFVVPGQGPDSDERFTPGWVFDGLGLVFDLDPCAPVAGGDHVPARARYTRLDDGLAQPWAGLVWCNAPFSASTAWARRFVAHGNGVWLGPVANAAWWLDLMRAAGVCWHCRDFAFSHPSHAGRRGDRRLLP